MHDYIIEAMVKALKQVLKNPAMAKQILDRFWSNKMALVWDVQDVHTAANEREVALTSREAFDILQELHRCHDKQCGIKWGDFTCYIEEWALGRKLVECRYLYAFGEGNALYQPVYLGSRQDVEQHECVLSQLKYKSAAEEDLR